MSPLHLVDQRVIIFTHIKPEERLKVCFPSYLETKISVSEAHILSSFPASFQDFRWSLEGMLPDNRAKNIFFFFCCFQKLWLFWWSECMFYQNSKFNCVSETNWDKQSKFLDTVFFREMCP